MDGDRASGRDWPAALVILKPETVVAWHRKGFRLFWTWKVRHGKPGRPKVPKETLDLIRRMSRENPMWGTQRIHGELLKLGSIDAIGASVDGRTNFSYKFNCRGNFSLADEVWIEARMHDILALYM